MKYIRLFSNLLNYFLLFSAIIFSNIFYDSYQGPKAFAFLLITILIFICYLFLNYKIKINFIFIVLFILYYYFFIQILFLNNYAAFYYSFIFLTPVVFFIPIFYQVNKYKISLFLNIILFISLIYGFIQFVSYDIKKPFSFFGNPIFFAEFVTILLPFAIFNLIMKKFKNIALLNIALYIIILFLCESRGVFISFILSSILFLIIFLKINKNISFDKKTLYYIALFIFFIVIFTPGFFLALQSFSNKFKSIILMNDENIFSRLLLIKSSFKIFLNNPILGGGPGSIKKFIQLKESEFLNNDNNIYTFVNSSYSHNDYVQILTETGIIGIFLYILILLFAFKKIENKIITCCFEEKVFLVCITFSLFFIIFESFFNFPLFIFPTSFFFFFLIGVSYSQYNYFITISNFSFKSKLLILFILFPLLVLFVKDINKIVSNIYLSSAIKESAYNTTNAEKLFKKTIFLDKKNFHNITNFASFYFNIEKYENSLLLFTMAIKDFPYSADLYYNIGMIYEIFKDYKNAINFYKMSLYLYPNFFDANLRLYNILFKIYPNDENKYLLYLQRILKYDSKFKPSSNFNIYYFKEETIATYSK